MNQDSIASTTNIYETLEHLRRLRREFDIMIQSATEDPSSIQTATLRQASEALIYYMERLEDLLGDADISDISLRQKRQAALAEIGLLTPDLKGLGSVLQRVVDMVTQLLPTSAGASIILWDADQEAFSLSASTIKNQNSAEITDNIRTKGGASRWMIDNQQALIMPDTSAHPLGDGHLIMHYDIGSLIGVPLTSKGDSLGILYSLDHEERHYNSGDIEFITILANRAAQAIAYAKVLEKTQRALQTTGNLFHVSSSVMTNSDTPSLLQTITDSVAGTLEASRVLIITFDLSARSVNHFVTGGPDKDALEQYDFETYWQGLSGWVIREDQAALSNSDGPDSRESPEIQAIREKEGSGPMIVAPLSNDQGVFGTLTVARSLGAPRYNEEDVRLVNALSTQAAAALSNADLIQSIQQLATVDELTNINNRRTFLRLAEHEFQRSKRTRKALSAIMFDIDFFKDVNDTYGHSVGDQVLKEVADRCLECIRTADVLGRYGGEEFVLVLPDTNLQVAQVIAERLRHSIGVTPFNTSMGNLEIHLTLGVSTAQADTETLVALIAQANKALITGKAMGRNCVMLA